ncbi:GEM-like protein 1 [Malania oleifera]|uniref:GEM-like protein 1 n=1 Tax=Malania oleifera TaxID=397392 RepID=UPI0025AECD63|nr:GEM-like protein 1 [Malania oleifera]
MSSSSATTNPYVYISPVPSGNPPVDTLCNVMGRLGKRVEGATRRAEGLFDNVWLHLKTSPSLTDAAMARLAQGTKVLTEGGHDKVFQQTFGILPAEKLLKSYACYFSTSSGPVIGTLYITTKRIAFCSDNPLCHDSFLGWKDWTYYKVLVQLDQLRAVNPLTNRLNPSEKYIQIVTKDGHELWFMGFISYKKAVENLSRALQYSTGGEPAGRMRQH